MGARLRTERAVTALGKRYIAVLRFPDDPVDEPAGFADDRLCKSEFAAAGVWHSYTSPRAEHVRTLSVDLDALPRTDFTPEQQAMYAERMALHWAAEFDRLAPCLGGHPARENETVQMRAVIEAMRPIVDAAIAWGESAMYGVDPTDFKLAEMLEDNRERLALAMSAWENSGTLTPEERLKANPAMLEPAEWSALFEVSRICYEGADVAYSVGPDLRRLLISAIDKLREQAAEVRR